MQQRHRAPGGLGVPHVRERRPGDRIPVQVLAGADRVHLVRPVPALDRRAAVGVFEDVDHRRAARPQMGEKTVLLQQPGD